MAAGFRETLTRDTASRGFGLPADAVDRKASVSFGDDRAELGHGAVAIAAITSCTNTSNPSVMLAAGLLARNAVARGLSVPGYVKTSLAPGSRLVGDYLRDLGLMTPLEALGFHIVGYGCTTCSGKSGPLRPEVEEAARTNHLVLVSVLSGNRNFEGRIHPTVRASYLASPPLVVAFAIAGRIDIDFATEPLGITDDGEPVMLGDVWPNRDEIETLLGTTQKPERFRESYRDVYAGTGHWRRLKAPSGPVFDWNPRSTYLRRPPFFELPPTVTGETLDGVRVLARFGDSLTTDHITPSGAISPDTVAGRFLADSGVAPKDFNAVTQRRGNHDFMARVTFGNPRLANLLVPEREGGMTRMSPNGEVLPIFEAAERYHEMEVPTMILAGRDYGMGSSRDWAAKGPRLLGVRLVLAMSFERIHRSNLIGMGILPMVFADGEDADTLGLSGFERFVFSGLCDALSRGSPVAVSADGLRFRVYLDVGTNRERELLRVGGIFERLRRRIEAVPDRPVVIL